MAFGTSGHRGSSLKTTFNDDHIAATSQAICEYRAAQGTDGPLFIGRDTHALSEPAWVTAIEVFQANGVHVLADADDGYTPTPAVSHAILTHNRPRVERARRRRGRHAVAQPAGRRRLQVQPAQRRPGRHRRHRLDRRTAPTSCSPRSSTGSSAGPIDRAGLGRYDFLGEYVADLPSVLDLDAVREAGVRIGADPLGGASVAYWGAIAERHGLDLTVVNPDVDPQFAFMTLDWDGKIRMDCSSPYAMASLVRVPGRLHHRHRQRRRLRPARHRHRRRPDEPQPLPGRRDRLPLRAPARLVARRRGRQDGRQLVDDRPGGRGPGPEAGGDPGRVQVVRAGLLDGSIGFGGEESAGASFLRRDGAAWSTDKDGIILALLASEITAVTGGTPSEHYRALTARFGEPAYARIDVATTARRRRSWAGCRRSDVTATELAGDPITARLTSAPGNGAPLGGLKVVTEGGWFAARPSGTEDVYKVYAESFRGPEHLARIQDEARRGGGGARSRVSCRALSGRSRAGRDRGAGRAPGRELRAPMTGGRRARRVSSGPSPTGAPRRARRRGEAAVAPCTGAPWRARRGRGARGCPGGAVAVPRTRHCLGAPDQLE